MEKEITLKDLYQIIKKHFLTIMIAIVLGIIMSVLVMMFFITPKYNSEAQLLVNQQGDTTQTSIQNNEIQANIQLINTYSDIITGHSILTQVNNNLGSNYPVKTLIDAIKVGQSTNSQAFNLTVTMETPEEAQLVLNEIINIFEATVREVYDVASILVLSPATYNPNKVSPKVTMFILIGAIMGLVISLLIVIILELMDTTIKEDDFLVQLGLINLGYVYELTNKELKQTRLSASQGQSGTRERI